MGQFQEKCGILCSTNYIINLVSNGTWGLSLMTILMTINLLVHGREREKETTWSRHRQN